PSRARVGKLTPDPGRVLQELMGRPRLLIIILHTSAPTGSGSLRITEARPPDPPRETTDPRARPAFRPPARALQDRRMPVASRPAARRRPAPGLQSLEDRAVPATPAGGLNFSGGFGKRFATEFTTANLGNTVFVCRSDPPDPAGSWRATSYLAVDANTFGDYDTLGVDGNGVYIGTINFSTTDVVGSTLTSIPKVDLVLP